MITITNKKEDKSLIILHYQCYYKIKILDKINNGGYDMEIQC